MRLSVAGNLLLAGEYLVLEEGGPGLALAVEPRLLASAHPAERWQVTAIMGGQRIVWQPPVLAGAAAPGANAAALPLVDAIFAVARDYLAARSLAWPAPLAIELDSGAFFDAAGRKAGYGSSAAGAVALAMLLCRQAGLSTADGAGPAAESPPDLLIALDGRGSGYDIFTSYHGGLGLFRGGRRPTWQALPDLRLPPARLYAGARAVASGGAVASFEAARRQQPDAVSACLDQARRLVLAMAAGRLGLWTGLRQARQLGLELGDLIGVPARLWPDFDQPTRYAKALGAGNELGLLLCHGDQSSPSAGLSDAAAADFGRHLLPGDGPRWLA